MNTRTTKLLEEAFARASKLPAKEQEALAAALILEELAGEAKWDEALNESQNALERLPDEALVEHKAQHTNPLS